MKIKPTLDRVIIKKCQFDTVYNTKVILTNKTKNDINKFLFEVIDVGPGGMINNHNVEMVVKPGDIVLVPEYIGSEINIDGQDYRIVRQVDIMGIYEVKNK